MQFIDEATIAIAAGNGGDGIVAWRREKYVPKGGPAGGDGGRGGDVVLIADPELGTLVDFRFKKQFSAESGKPGSTSNKSGKAGDELVIRVPVGTLVTRTTIDGEGNRGTPRLFADLSTPNERLRVGEIEFAHRKNSRLFNQRGIPRSQFAFDRRFVVQHLVERLCAVEQVYECTRALDVFEKLIA